MNEIEFKPRLSNLRHDAEGLLCEDLTTEQLAALGAEHHKQMELVVDRLRDMGKLYRSRD